MAYTETWDETVPAGTRDANLGDDDIRAFKTAVRERLQGGGMYFPATDDSDAGIHNYVKLKEQSSNPTQEADRGFLFSKDVDSVTELHYMDSSGNVFQITSAGEVLITALGGYAARGDMIRGGASGWEKQALGASGKYWKSDGTDADWGDFVAPDGYVLQGVSSNDSGAVDTTTDHIPVDDTVPLPASEGKKILTRTITLSSATAKLAIFAVANVSCSTGGTVHAYVTWNHPGGSETVLKIASNGETGSRERSIPIMHMFTPGTTNEITLALYFGSEAGTATLNGSGGNRRFGGKEISELIAFEVKAS